MKRHTANQVLAFAVLLVLVGRVAHALEASFGGPLQFQEVVTVRGATREQIYDSALDWFSQNFQGAKEPLEQDRLTGVLVGRGSERYVPPFLANACNGWLRYRVMVVAREGRYYYTIDGFTHVGDQSCQKRSFGLLTSDWLSATIRRTIFNLTLQPTRREDEDKETWLDLRKKATAVGAALSGSLRAKLATAAGRKPAT